MINAGDFLTSCMGRGFRFFTGTPCSYLKPIINYVMSDDAFSFVNAANEGDAVALASGATLAGKKSVVMFQNSGLGNAVNPLTSLSYPFKIPLLLIVTLRGEPGGPKDEPQHELMGKITTDLLDNMRIGWTYFPESTDKIKTVLGQEGGNRISLNKKSAASPGSSIQTAVFVNHQRSDVIIIQTLFNIEVNAFFCAVIKFEYTILRCTDQ